MKITIEHGLGREAALKRLKQFTDTAPNQYKSQISDFRVNWKDNKADFNFMIAKTKIEANLEVLNATVAVNCKVPFAFLLFKSQILSVVRQKAMEILKL